MKRFAGLGVLLVVALGILLLEVRRGLDATSLRHDAGESDEETDPTRSDPRALPSPDSPQDSADGGFHLPRTPEEFARARAERDALRERIFRALGTPLETDAGFDAGPRTFGGYAFMPADDAGQIDPAYIQSVVHDDYFPLAKACYANLLAKSPDAGGRVAFDFTIVGDPSVGGIVESAEPTDASTLTDPEMVECMKQSMLSITFAPPPEGGKVTVTYPIEFTPD